MEEKKVSVIMPTYNRAYCISPAINSIINQSYSNWELIIVDDGSSDDTEEKMKHHLFLDNRIRYKKLSTNVGASEARNIGMKQATGDFITFLDTDDEYMPTKLESQLNFFLASKNKRLGIVSCGAIDFLNGSEYNRRMPIKRKEYYKSLLSKKKRIGAGTPFLMIKSKIVKDDHIYFDSSLKAMEDWDFVLRISKSYDFDFVREFLVKVNHHQNERLYTSKNAVEALKLQYTKYQEWLIEEPRSHKKFVKNAAALIAHHDSIFNSIYFINCALPHFDNINKIDLIAFKNVIKLFHFNLVKLFYLKFLK